jgi:competence protein CoiA
MYYGRVYYWTPNSESKLFPVHYSPAKRWIEETSWFDPDLQEERNEGGFWLTYRTVKKPNYGQLVDIAKDFTRKPRNAFEPKNVKKSIPECTIFKDNLKDWWDKGEYKNIDKQFAIFKDKPRPTFIAEYNYSDDYDESEDFEDER